MRCYYDHWEHHPRTFFDTKDTCTLEGILLFKYLYTFYCAFRYVLTHVCSILSKFTSSQAYKLIDLKGLRE